MQTHNSKEMEATTQELIKAFMTREALLETLAQATREYEQRCKEFMDQYLKENDDSIPPIIIVGLTAKESLLLDINEESGKVESINRVAGVPGKLPPVELTPKSELEKRVTERMAAFTNKK